MSCQNLFYLFFPEHFVFYTLLPSFNRWHASFPDVFAACDNPPAKQDMEFVSSRGSGRMRSCDEKSLQEVWREVREASVKVLRVGAVRRA